MNLFSSRSSSQVNPINFALGSTSENWIYSEVLFNSILNLEQKRSERSGLPFMLMLLDIQGLVSNDNGNCNALKDKMLYALRRSTRDIDQRGWYVQDYVMGVIFSELSNQEIDHIKDLIWRRVQSRLCQTIRPQELQQVDVRLHLFPEDAMLD